VNAPVRASGRIALEEHAFFAGLDPAFLAAIARDARIATFDAGAPILTEGEPADALFLVTAGKVALEIFAPDRPRRTIQTLGPGEVLGWSWLIPPHRWRLDGRAVRPTTAIALQAATVRRAMEERPEDGYRLLLRLLPVITQRLEHTRIQLLDLHGIDRA